MPTDPSDDMLRDQARLLAAELLRDPMLALGYRDALLEAVEDSDFEGKLLDWFNTAGYATDHAHLSAAFLEGPQMNLAFFDGSYLLRVDGTIFELEIGAVGVLLNGVGVADPKFSDGVLRFPASELSPWSGELRFTASAKGEKPWADGTVIQHTCTGRLWDPKSPTAGGAVANAVGSTRRVVLGAERAAPLSAASISSSSAALRAGSRVGDAAIDWSAFLAEWGGDYHVRLSEGSEDATTTRTLKVKAKDTGIELTYSEPGSTPTTPTTARQTPPDDELWYQDNQLKFELTFMSFGENLKTFAGKIYPINGTAPEAPNAFGAFAKAEAKWGVDLITATWIAALGTFLAIVGPIIAYVFATRDADAIKTAIEELGKSHDISKKPSPTMSMFADDPAERLVGERRLGQDFGERAVIEASTAKKETQKVDDLAIQLTSLKDTTAQTEHDLAEAEAKDLPTKEGLRKQLAEEKLTIADKSHEAARSKDRADKAHDKGKAVVEKKKKLDGEV